MNALGFVPRIGALVLMGSAIVALAAVSYVFVERPLINRGKRPGRVGEKPLAWRRLRRA